MPCAAFRHESGPCSTLFRKVADHDKADRAGEDRDEGIGEQIDREGLRQHDDAAADYDGRSHFPTAAPEPAHPAIPLGCKLPAHLRTAPKVIPRSRCLRSTMVKK